MEKKIDLILAELQKLNDRVTNIETNMTNIEANMTNIEANMTNIEANMTNIEANMATKEDVAHISAIKQAVMETADIVKEIDNKVEDQQENKVQIQVLNRRLFALETTLERLSRQ